MERDARLVRVLVRVEGRAAGFVGGGVAVGCVVWRLDGGAVFGGRGNDFGGGFCLVAGQRSGVAMGRSSSVESSSDSALSGGGLVASSSLRVSADVDVFAGVAAVSV